MTSSRRCTLLLTSFLCFSSPLWAQDEVSSGGSESSAFAIVTQAQAAAEAILSDARAAAEALLASANESASERVARAAELADGLQATAEAAAEEIRGAAETAAAAREAEAEAMVTAAETTVDEAQLIAARLREDAIADAAESRANAQSAAQEILDAAEAQAAQIVATAEAEANELTEAEMAAAIEAARAQVEEEMRSEAVRFIEEERIRIAAEEEAARIAAEEAARIAAEEAARQAALDALASCTDRAGPADAGVPLSEENQDRALQRLRAAQTACEAAIEGVPEEAGLAYFHLATLEQTSGRHRQAVELYETAADLGVDAANTRLGDYYLFGARPIRPDPDEAAVRFEAASAAGDLPAKTTLGFMYLLGIGVENDAERALDLMQEAADGGYHFAQYRLGQIYLTGDEMRRVDQEALGIPNAERAIELLAAASGSGNSEATLVLAELFSGAGDARLPQDDAARFRWTREAADQGLPAAINALGFLYERGIGTLPNPTRAAELYIEALEAGLNVANLRGQIDGFLPEWELETARAFQIELQARGLYDGAIDGIIGAGTITAAQGLEGG